MDTKLKSSKNNYFLSVIVYILVIMTSIGLVASYPRISKLANEKEKPSYFEDYNFQMDLYKGSFVLYKDLLEKEQNKDIPADEIFFKEYKGYSENDMTDYSFIKRNINYEIGNWNKVLKRELKNLDYYIIDKKTNTFSSNTEKKLSDLILNEDNKEVLNDLDNYYGYYMVIDYNEYGEISINKIKGANENVISTFLDFQWKNLINGDSDFVLSNPKNITIVYGVPNDLKYVDRISNYINGADSYAYENIILFYVLIAYILIMFISLVIPFRKSKDIIGVKNFIKIPFELNIIIMPTITSLLALSPNIVYETVNNEWVKESLVRVGIPFEFTNSILMIGNIAYWFVLLITAFTAVLLIKYIFNKGLKNYIKENTIIYKIFRLIKRIWTKIYDEVTNIDLNDKSNKIIIKILAVNFIALAFMSIIWFLGVGAAIIYTIFLYFVLRKYFNDIRNKYQILLEATNKIAEGNLDVTIEEELGVFEPLKDELQKIQKGFKNAVNEEVKSQRMKTELISNVSHDLKTPLTSIITYIDLLKDENISEENRKLYLDTLDRKSQRLKNLIEDLFEVSKATSKNIQLNIVNVDIVSLMKQTQFELSDKIEESSLKFKWNFPGNKVIVPLDSQKTFRVFENLLINIVKYSMQNSRVFIDIIDGNEEVYVTLRNMSANEIDFTAEEIVERFARGDKSRNTEGSGLGLAIAKSFVELQGGTLNIEIDGDLFKVILKFKK
ncbi:MAG: sensor histidine kinase [Clostridium sp.]|uniref:sensor histidine kinase n=1 Tax=Clostridium sp. TaxID=1506 RepID=UPI001EBD0471|nr:sensor histidine kinase [Clostridium sp.]MBS5884647.1 sensor histidine kinase [Clostridium sp.]MDU7148918.1 sensor histidine kinase [Clostridium sp.]MDU7242487.1 sensor histidine kinase [Clostridium sp.]